MVEVVYKNRTCGSRLESVIGSYADYSLNGDKLIVHDVELYGGQEVIIIHAKDVVKISYIDVD